MNSNEQAARYKATPQNVTILVREWFDKVNGNSYITARIDLDGVPFTVHMAYGYSGTASAWQEALPAMRAAGFDVPEQAWRLRDKGAHIITDLVEVRRVKDLHCGGKSESKCALHSEEEARVA